MRRSGRSKRDRSSVSATSVGLHARRMSVFWFSTVDALLLGWIYCLICGRRRARFEKITMSPFQPQNRTLILGNVDTTLQLLTWNQEH